MQIPLAAPPEGKLVTAPIEEPPPPLPRAPSRPLDLEDDEEYVPLSRRRRRSGVPFGCVAFVFAAVLTTGIVLLISGLNRDGKPAKPAVQQPAVPLDMPVGESSIVIGYVLLGIVGLIIYLLPTIIGAIRGHENLLAVFAMNFFLGWVFVGWAVAMVWACWRVGPKKHVHVHYHKY